MSKTSENVSRLGRAALTVPEWAIIHMPGRIGRSLRAAYWKRRLGAMGERCIIEPGVQIHSPEDVFLGDDVWLDAYVQIIAGKPLPRRNMRIRPNEHYRGALGEVHLRGGNHVAPFCILQGHAGIWLGRDVGVAAHSLIYSLSNHYRFDARHDEFPSSYETAIKFSPFAPEDASALIGGAVVFEDGAGLGLNCVVHPGSTVSRYSWVGSSSVVSGFVPEAVIAAGNPLRVLKNRYTSSAPAT